MRVIDGGEFSSPSGRLRCRWLMASSIMVAVLLSTFACPTLLRAFGLRLQRATRLMSSKYASTVAGHSPTLQPANRDAARGNVRERRTPGIVGGGRALSEARRTRRADLIRKQVADGVCGSLVLGGNRVRISVERELYGAVPEAAADGFDIDVLANEQRSLGVTEDVRS